jgi:hypothetical protein
MEGAPMRKQWLLVLAIALTGCADPAQPAKDAVLKELRDPSSAQWRDITYPIAGNSIDICGYVNAKNGFGGYTGFRRFRYMGAGVEWEEASPGMNKFKFDTCPKDQFYRHDS